MDIFILLYSINYKVELGGNGVAKNKSSIGLKYLCICMSTSA